MASPPGHPGIRIDGARPSPGGRRMTATRTYPPGALVATFSAPLVAIPAGPAAKATCAACLLPSLPVKACTGCRAVAYCSAACQRADWSGVHKAECRAFKRVRAKVQQDWLPTPVRALVQVLLRLGAGEGADAAREELGRLEGNVEGFRAHKVWKDLEMQAMAGCTYAGWETSEENLRLAEEILCKIQTNSFDRSDPDVGQTGTFLDSTLAMVNHSCVPNAIVAFSKRKAFLRAEEEIKEGDEITISYIDYTKPKIFRQHGLELYHFECSCPRCKDDLDVYQVFQKSPLVPLNSFSFVPNYKKLRKTPIDSKVAQDPAFRAQIEKIYVACSPEARVAPEQRFANLCQQWRHCEPLIREQMWAVEPLANVFQQAISYFTEQGNFLHALAVECFVAVRSDPYKYAAPFKQWRLKGLLMIAKTITNTELPTGQGQTKVHPGVVAAFEKADLSSLYQAILLMTLKYGERAHSDEWSILAEAKAMLEDIESLEQRKEASIILHEWADNPEHPLAQSFFRERAVKPVEELAGLAIEIMKAEFGSDKAMVRR